MTVTQRRVRADPARPEDRIVTEPGIKYTCDSCGVDITHTVRIKCASKDCEEVDLCPSCFSEGKEIQRHKADHPYKVVEQHSYPIFTSEWGADEELLLISGLIHNGLGNWAEAAEHVGTRTKEECEKHYLEVYLGVGDGKEAKRGSSVDIDGETHRDFMPPMNREFHIDPDEFQARKKARIEEMRKPHSLPAAPLAPLVSAPTNHEIAGFMPGRLEFEHEIENDAELAVKDMEFGLVFKYGGDEQPMAKITRPVEDDEGEGDDGEEGEEDVADVKTIKEEGEEMVKEEPTAEGDESSKTGNKRKRDNEKTPVDPPTEIEDEDELEIKLTMLSIYFAKLDKREEAKEIIFDRALTEHKRILAIERKRPKEERELIGRYKVFAKLQSAHNFEVLIEGLIYEQQLRRRVLELQEYRRSGVTTGAESDVYDQAKAARAGYRPVPAQVEIVRTGARINAGQHRHLYGTPPPGTDVRRPEDSRDATPRVVGNGGRKPPAPLNLANAESVELLTPEERELCASIRMFPCPYLALKEQFILENIARNGFLKRREARKLNKIDVNKSGRIFDFLVAHGYLRLAYNPNIKVLKRQKYSDDQAAPVDIPVTRTAHGHQDSTPLSTTINGVNGVNGVIVV